MNVGPFAPDREQRGPHPQDLAVAALRARRVMPGVLKRLVKTNISGHRNLVRRHAAFEEIG